MNQCYAITIHRLARHNVEFQSRRGITDHRARQILARVQNGYFTVAAWLLRAYWRCDVAFTAKHRVPRRNYWYASYRRFNSFTPPISSPSSAPAPAHFSLLHYLCLSSLFLLTYLPTPLHETPLASSRVMEAQTARAKWEARAFLIYPLELKHGTYAYTHGHTHIHMQIACRGVHVRTVSINWSISSFYVILKRRLAGISRSFKLSAVVKTSMPFSFIISKWFY